MIAREKNLRIGMLIPKAIESPAVVRLYNSIAYFAKSIGIETVGEPEDLKPAGALNFLSSLNGRMHLYYRLTEVVLAFDTLLTLYPLFNPRKKLIRAIDLSLWKVIGKHTRIIAYVYDLPIVQVPPPSKAERMRALELEREFFDLIDVFMVFNDEMAKYLNKQGIENKRIVTYEILDHYGPPPPPLKPLGKPVRIVYAGALSRETVGPLERLGKCGNCRYVFYGKDEGFLKGIMREDFEYRGFIPPTKIYKHLQEADFGLLSYHPRKAYYMRLGHGDKFTLYIASGLPVITLSNLEYPVKLVEKYRVGYIARSLEEIPDIVANITEEEYRKTRQNVIQLSRKITQGYFFKKAFLEAIKKM